MNSHFVVNLQLRQFHFVLFCGCSFIKLPNQIPNSSKIVLVKKYITRILFKLIYCFFSINMLSATASRVATKIQPKLAQATRNMTVVSGPPTVRISFAEKVAHGVALVVGISAIPVWVLVNLKHYRAPAE